MEVFVMLGLIALIANFIIFLDWWSRRKERRLHRMHSDRPL